MPRRSPRGTRGHRVAGESGVHTEITEQSSERDASAPHHRHHPAAFLAMRRSCTTASLALYFERRCMTGAAWTAGASGIEDGTRECVGVSVLLTLAHAVRGIAGTRRIKGSSLILRGHAISQGEPRGAMQRSKGHSASQRIGPDLRTISPAFSASHARGEPAPSPR